MWKGSYARVAIWLGVLLMGCGTNGFAGSGGTAGGGGVGGVGGTGGSEVVVPTVTETVPPDMSTDVASDTTVRASFDTPLDEATVTAASFVVRRGDGTPVVGSVTVDMTGLTAIFTPDVPLNLSSSYTATLTTNVKSVSGGSLSADYGWGFATRDGTWIGAEAIDTGDTEAISPHVALDASGNAIAVWSQVEGLDFRIWANRFVRPSGWGDAATIGDMGVAGTSRVAVDPGGDGIAVWDEHDGTSSNIWANRFTPMGGWGGGQTIEGNIGNAESARIAVDTNGNATAVWRQQEGARFDIWANRFVADTGWGTAQKIEVNNSGNANFPQVAVDPAGSAMAVWGQSDGTRINVWANRFRPATGWENAMLLENAGGNAVLPDVGRGLSGTAIAVWSQTDGTRHNIWSNRFTRVTSWVGARLIEADDAGDAGGVKVAVDPRGNALAVWQQSDGTVTSIWANRFTPMGGWEEAVLIENDDAGNADSPRVAIDPSGSAMAVWSQSDGTRRNVWANQFTPAVGWGTPQLLEVGDAGDAVNPEIALDPGGRGMAIWSSNDGTRSGIWVNRFE